MSGGQYRTNQRKLILDYIIKNNGRHVTADDTLFALRQEGHSVGKATIYRYFDRLVEDGLLLKYSSAEGSSACYEYAGHGALCSSHYHMKCDRCGELLHLECDFLDGIAAHMKENHDFKLNKFKTIFYGICSKCESKTDQGEHHV